MNQSSGPLVIFGVYSAPDPRNFPSVDAVWVPMTPRLSVAPLPPSTVLFTPTSFVTSDVHQSLQDELNKLWRSAEAESTGHSILDHEYKFSVLFSSLILWRWLVRYTIQALGPSKILLPERCINDDFATSPQSDIFELVLYKVLEEETRQTDRDYFTEGEGRLSTQNLTITFSSFVQNFVGFTAQVIDKARKFFLVKSLPLKFTDFRTRLTWRGRLLGAFGRSRSNQVQNVLVIAQLRKVRSILRYRSPGVRMGYLSYSQFEKIVSPKNGQKPFEILSPSQSAQSVLLNYFQSLVEYSRDSQESIDHLLRGNWSTLVTDAQHHPQVRSLIDRGIEAGKRVAIVPEGAISYVGFQERFGRALFHDNPRVMRFVLDEAQKEYWLRAGTPDSSISVSGYFGGDHPTTKRRLSVESSLLNACFRGLPDSEKGVTVMLSCDGFFFFIEHGMPGSECMSVTLMQLVQVVDELLVLGYRVLASTRDHEVKRYLQDKFVGRSAMFTTSIPWQILADKSNIVIARDSSIGWQSLSGSKPVLMWSFGDLPSCMEVTLDGIPDYWVGVARSIGELDVEITALLARHREESLLSGVDGYLPPPVSSRTDAVLEWMSSSISS